MTFVTSIDNLMCIHCEDSYSIDGEYSCTCDCECFIFPKYEKRKINPAIKKSHSDYYAEQCDIDNENIVFYDMDTAPKCGMEHNYRIPVICNSCGNYDYLYDYVVCH